MKLQGLYLDCAISGSSPEDFQVTEFHLEEGLSTLFTLTLTLVSYRSDIDIKSLLLKQASLSVFSDGKLKRKVEGIVSTANIGETGFNRTFYKITIRPTLWLLSQRENSRIFHNKTVPEILEQLLSEYDISFDNKIEQIHPQREYTTQKRESDLEFWTRLAAEEGIVFWFECQSGGNEKCYLSDSRAGLTSGTKAKYNPHPQTLQTGNIINKISLSVAMTPQKVIGKDRMYDKPAYRYEHDAEDNKLNVNSNKYSIYDSYARFPADEVGKQIAQYRLCAVQAESEVGEAKSNCIEIRPGNIFTVSEHPNPQLNGRWQPVKVVHKGTMPQAMEEDSDGKPANLTNEIWFIPAQSEWHAPFKHKPLVDGPEVAEVVGPPGEEIFTNELGQVKVHFHWNRYDEPNDRASCWVRVAQGWNGHDYGFYAIPRIGQEVIVSYLDGDVDRPIITGCVYNGDTNVPLSLPDKKTQTTFKTKTHKGEGFNELRFDDDNGHEEFYIHAQKDMNTSVRNDRTTQVDHDHSENVDNNQSICVGVDQDEKIGHDQTLDVGNDQTETIGNNRTVTVNSNDTLTVKANQTETVFIAKAESIGAAKALTIGGAYQITVGAAMNTTVGLAKTEQVGLEKNMMIGKSYSQLVGKDKRVNITKNQIVTIGQNEQVQIGKSQSVNVQDNIQFIAGKNIEIICGKSKIRMDKSGKILIEGDIFTVKTTGNQTLKAKRDVVIKGKNIKEN